MTRRMRARRSTRRENTFLRLSYCAPCTKLSFLPFPHLYSCPGDGAGSRQSVLLRLGGVGTEDTGTGEWDIDCIAFFSFFPPLFLIPLLHQSKLPESKSQET